MLEKITLNIEGSPQGVEKLKNSIFLNMVNH